jgi:hypothetical protein
MELIFLFAETQVFHIFFVFYGLLEGFFNFACNRLKFVEPFFTVEKGFEMLIGNIFVELGKCLVNTGFVSINSSFILRNAKAKAASSIRSSKGTVESFWMIFSLRAGTKSVLCVGDRYETEGLFLFHHQFDIPKV